MAKSALGPERYVLSLALLVPLGIVLVGLLQLPGIGLAAPSTIVRADATPLSAQRPAGSQAQPPPTLAAPTATPRPTEPPRPTATPIPPSPTPEKNRRYTVQHGDELKNIAAQYGVSIWKIIASNDIPDPDSLRVGQVLKIPDE